MSTHKRHKTASSASAGTSTADAQTLMMQQAMQSMAMQQQLAALAGPYASMYNPMMFGDMSALMSTATMPTSTSTTPTVADAGESFADVLGKIKSPSTTSTAASTPKPSTTTNGATTPTVNGDTQRLPPTAFPGAKPTVKRPASNHKTSSAAKTAKLDSAVTPTSAAMSSNIFGADLMAGLGDMGQMAMMGNYEQQAAAALLSALAQSQSSSNDINAQLLQASMQAFMGMGSMPSPTPPAATTTPTPKARATPTPKVRAPSTSSRHSHADTQRLTPSQSRGCVASPSGSHTSGKDSVDETIDSVLKRTTPAPTPHAPSTSGETPLDLSSAQPPPSVVVNGATPSPSTSAQTSAASAAVRRVGAVDALRAPMSAGWRRQTTVRGITAGGVRGDVIYHTPDGQRLTSWADTQKYLKANQEECRGLGRDNFNFGAKTIVGEYFQVTHDGDKKNAIKQMSEEQVLTEIESLLSKVGGLKPTQNGIEKADTKIAENGHSTPATKTPQKESAAAQAERLAAEQLAMLQKQSEDYYRLLLAACEQQAQLTEQEQFTQQLLKAQQIQDQRRREAAAKSAISGVHDDTRPSSPPPSKPVDERVRLHRLEMQIMEEEKETAKQLAQQRVRGSRIPDDDLELTETKCMPKLARITHMQLSGRAFADILMTQEFIGNFAHVLKIDASTLPSLSECHAGLLGDIKSVGQLRRLCMVLLKLVLEYPGLPAHSRTHVGQSVRNVTLNKANYSEMLRLFLASRSDPEARQLAVHLVDTSWETLSADVQAATLALMCNELLMCRNVVREIEQNVEESTRLRGEKWAQEGKLRAIRLVQSKKRLAIKRLAKKAKREDSLKLENADDSMDASLSNGVKIESNGLKLESACSSPAPTSDGEESKPPKLENGIPSPSKPATPAADTSAAVDSDDDDGETIADKRPLGCIVRKAVGPGSIQPDALTVEEQAMSVEELDDLARVVEKDSADYAEKIEVVGAKVRTQPHGQDRYHRFYWTLSAVPGVLVEGLESARVHNPALEDEPVVKHSYAAVNSFGDASGRGTTSVEPAVRHVLKDLVERVVRITDFYTDSGYTRAHPVPLAVRDGWWHIQDGTTIDRVKAATLPRGIRERNLHRLLSKIAGHTRERVFQRQLSIDAVDPTTTTGKSAADNDAAMRLLAALKLFEARLVHANVQTKDFTPVFMPMPQPVKHTQPTANGGVPLTTPTTTTTTTNGTSTADEDSRSQTSADTDADDDARVTLEDLHKCRLADTPTCADVMACVREHLLYIETHIERRYLRNAFHASLVLAPETVLASTNEDELENEDELTQDGGDLDETGSQTSHKDDDTMSAVSAATGDEVAAGLMRWRHGVTVSTSPAQLMLCIQQLDAQIAWERSVMRAACQVCRGGENEHQLLLCDCCDKGFHTYCFRPSMTQIPDGDWFCPACVAQASAVPCCLVCRRQAPVPPLRCRQCQYDLHPECVDLVPDTPPELNWLCPTCARIQREHVAKTQRQDGRTMRGRGRGRGRPPLTSLRDTSPMKPYVPTAPAHFSEICNVVLAELDSHKDSTPFKMPVDTKACPLYRKIIKQPIDLSAIRTKLTQNKYANENQFAEDIQLMFANCRTFNEDDSPVGKSGVLLRRYFNRRWRELKETMKTPRVRGAPTS